MRMARMEEYLENRGFEVNMRYSRDDKLYWFLIIKDNKALTKSFKYPEGFSDEEKDRIQTRFLEEFLDKWENLYGNENRMEIKLNRPGGNYDAQLRAYEFLQKEFNMRKKDIVPLLRNAVFNKKTGILQVDDTRIPVCITSLREKNGEDPMVLCTVQTPTKETQYAEYCRQDVEMTTTIIKRMLNSVYGAHGQYGHQIKDVIFNPPATIVFWKDGTKTVVKAWGEDYDPEKGLAMAIAKKTLGNKHDYYNTFKKWLKKAPKEEH